MRRESLHLFPLISILLLSSAFSYGQSWTGILSSSRAIDWSTAGLPATLPSGETTANPWTPPTRTQCVTAQCNTVAGGSVTATTINAAITSAPAGTYVLVPAGTFPLGGNISMNKNYVTLRGAGASSTIFTGGQINIGIGISWGGASLLTVNPSKGDTAITVASAPTAGRIAALEQCDDGLRAANANFTHFGSGTVCTGSYSDPVGPWICGLNSACDMNNGNAANPHVQAQIVWIPTGGVSGNTINFTSPVYMPNWSTARTASLTWLSNTGVVGAGVEDLSVNGTANGIHFSGTYACWAKGVRIASTNTNSPQVLTFFFDAHSLVANSYIAGTVGGTEAQLITFGSNSGEQGQSDHLFINNIVEGGWAEGGGTAVDLVFAYNYWYRSGSTWVENGEFQHAGGTSFLLREGNQMGKSADDATWGTHNFNSWFRNWVSDYDPPLGCVGTDGLDIGSWARFENVIGNVLGNTSCNYAYGLILRVNNNGVREDQTGLTEASLMVWGNYARCTGDSHCNTVTWNSSDVPSNLSSFGSNSTPYQNPVPGNHNLPASFFMNSMTAHPSGGTGLSWWKVCTSWTTFPTNCATYSTPPFPTFGPDVTGGPNMNGFAYNVPAALARMNLPGDPAYGNAIRQFDERVYQSDSGGALPDPPSGLAAAVH
jgi:hypothetical protein